MIKIFKVLFFILLIIALVIIVSVMVGKFFENQSIYYVSKESTIRLEKFLTEYQKGDRYSVKKYHLSYCHEIPNQDYKKFQYKLISAKNIGDSELNIKTIFKVTLFYDRRKINYEVIQYFSTLIAGEVRMTQNDIQKGFWGMDWYIVK
jgi:hypothetical protein